MPTVLSPAHKIRCTLNRVKMERGDSTFTAGLKGEEKRYEAVSKLDPSVKEFTPVWPLPPPPHLRSAALKPLLFPEPVKEDRSHLLKRSRDLPLPCVMCESFYGEGREKEEEGEKIWNNARDNILRHLLDDHCIVIHQVDHIASLRSYLQYWRNKLTSDNISTYCPVIKTNTQPNDVGPSKEYYLMSDALPEDSQLRQSLQLARLGAILDQQQLEREDTGFKRSCLFCGVVVEGNRSGLFKHMLDCHNFSVGQPDNLVFVEEFLNLLQNKLDRLLCLYCEKEFRDRNVLKEHMRKKQHKMINPNNTEYDRFYVINYLEPGRRWKDIMAESADDVSSRRSAEEDWEDWNEDRKPQLHCLFCSSFKSTLLTLTDHMKVAHKFDWAESIGCHDYYKQVKAVNFIRRQVAMQHCPTCHTHFLSEADLMLHMEVKGHYGLPSDISVWDEAQYLFQTFENDALLCCLDDHEGSTN